MKSISIVLLILLAGMLLVMPAGSAQAESPQPLTDSDLSIGGITMGTGMDEASAMSGLSRVGQGWLQGETVWDAVFAKDGEHISYVSTTFAEWVTPRGIGVGALADAVIATYGEPVARAEEYHYAMFYMSDSGYLVFFTDARGEVERVTRIAFIQKSDDMIILFENEVDIDADGLKETVQFAVPDIGLNAEFSHVAPIRMSVSQGKRQAETDVFVGGLNDNLVLSVEAAGCFGDTPMIIVSGDVHGATGWGHALYEGYQWKDGMLTPLFSFDQWNEEITNVEPFLSQFKIKQSIDEVYMGRPTAAEWEGQKTLCVPLWLLNGSYPFHESDDVRFNAYVRYEQGEWRTLGVERVVD